MSRKWIVWSFPKLSFHFCPLIIIYGTSISSPFDMSCTCRNPTFYSTRFNLIRVYLIVLIILFTRSKSSLKKLISLIFIINYTTGRDILKLSAGIVTFTKIKFYDFN